MTLARFKRIIVEELDPALHKEFLQMFGKLREKGRSDSDGWIEYHTSLQIDRHKWMTKQDKIDTVKTIARVYATLRKRRNLDTNERHYLFSRGLCLRNSEAFNIFEKAPAHIQDSQAIYRISFGKDPKDLFTIYMRLLSRINFHEELLSSAGRVPEQYLEDARALIDDPTLDFSDLSSYLYHMLLDKHELSAFNLNKIVVVILMRAHYGAEKFENAFRLFRDVDFTVQPADLVYILDNWDELGSYPAEWLIELLSLEEC